MKKQLVRLVATALALIATMTVTTACVLYWHRPEVPAELLRK